MSAKTSGIIQVVITAAFAIFEAVLLITGGLKLLNVVLFVLWIVCGVIAVLNLRTVLRAEKNAERDRDDGE
jgi:ABC-type bacteriocin/lantibiotic exporter with double-glycine peptidase domain